MIASAAALCDELYAVVISLEYRHAPEHPFPAAHEDVLAGYEWAVENSGQYNADADRLALVGESVGGNMGNMVVATAMAARNQQLTEPDHVVSVYPVAQSNFNTESYEANEAALPLSLAMMA
ncbi:alpha/beta hydrolase fold domain-containing protein [uncultured Jannaschia sp.]|uniref:alpha/beta hydrolase fold domain-containing protein n=1 Tax=uncultured Jannaschia sp. TaxID=293347 RepID=UPI003432E749